MWKWRNPGRKMRKIRRELILVPGLPVAHERTRCGRVLPICGPEGAGNLEKRTTGLCLANGHLRQGSIRLWIARLSIDGYLIFRNSWRCTVRVETTSRHFPRRPPRDPGGQMKPYADPDAAIWGAGDAKLRTTFLLIHRSLNPMRPNCRGQISFSSTALESRFCLFVCSRRDGRFARSCHFLRLMWVVGLAGGAPCSVAARATHTSIPPRLSRWAAERSMCQTRPPQRRRQQDYGLLPNKGCCRNSGRNEIECDSRCRRRARRSSAHRRAAPILSDNSHRNGKKCRCGAGMPCSGTDKPDPVHLWRSPEASRSGIGRSVPSVLLHLNVPAILANFSACRRAPGDRSRPVSPRDA
jgi:hypothetical protein